GRVGRLAQRGEPGTRPHSPAVGDGAHSREPVSGREAPRCRPPNPPPPAPGTAHHSSVHRQFRRRPRLIESNLEWTARKHSDQSGDAVVTVDYGYGTNLFSPPRPGAAH